MKVGFHHYFLAHTFSFSVVIGIAGSIGALLSTLHEEGLLMGEWPVIGWILLAAIPVAGIGYIFGCVFVWMVLGSIVGKIQGWPFTVGDEVVILTGENKGVVAKIYEVWADCGQVRVELGDEAKASVTDVYCSVTVARTSKAK